MELLDIIREVIKIKEPKLSSINTILKEIVEFADANGAILWEKNSSTNHLFTAALWFQGENKHAIHDLPFDGSSTGKAILHMTTIYVPVVEDEGLDYRNSSFWDSFNLKSLLILPLIYNDGNHGSLNLYSTKTNPFTKEKIKDLELFANLLPEFYQTIRNHVTLNLLTKVDNKLRISKMENKKSALSDKEMRSLLQSICAILEDTFQCFEASIFLEDPFGEASGFKCLATTWNDKYKERIYKANEKNGLTGWILKNKKPVRITDLTLFWKQVEVIRKEYPNITWLSNNDIKSLVAEKLNLDLSNDDKLPPISFIGAPIFVGKKAFGAIRCSAAINSPFYLGSGELEMLSLIATRLTTMWENWIQQRLIDEEVNTWRKVVEATGEIDLFVLKELEKENPDQDKIFNTVLSTLPELVSDAEILDVRLFDAKRQVLYFAATYGDAWERGNEDEISSRKLKTFPVSTDDANAGAYVYKKKLTLILDPIKKTNPYNETFKRIKKIIVAPLLVGDYVLGVIDVRSTKEKPFEPTAAPIIELMGRQLAVYCHLVATIHELGAIRGQHLKTFQDFIHQLRGPINQAFARSRLAIMATRNSKIEIPANLVRNIKATSGLCNKANRVATNIRLFSDLAKNKPIKLNKTRVYPTEVTKLLIETAADNKIMMNPTRNINLEIETKSLEILKDILVDLDIKMLEQSINVLLDNAIKYSYPESEISVFASHTKSGRFQITVKNRGLPISQEESKLCSQYGWRSKEAEFTTGEGGGIGLWIVDNIMKAHGGDLLVIPTDEIGHTLIKLIFPVRL